MPTLVELGNVRSAHEYSKKSPLQTNAISEAGIAMQVRKVVS
jgi:hypothetical protein